MLQQKDLLHGLFAAFLSCCSVSCWLDAVHREIPAVLRKERKRPGRRNRLRKERKRPGRRNQLRKTRKRPGRRDRLRLGKRLKKQN